MSILYVLIPIALLLTALGIYIFFWAVKSNQFDDLEKQGLSILFEENQKDGKDESKRIAEQSSEDTKENR